VAQLGQLAHFAGKRAEGCGAGRTAEGEVGRPEALQRVFEAREGRLLGQLAQRMQAAASGGTDTFDTWMLRESDTVQAVALSYGEREVLAACWRAADQVGPRRDLSLCLSLSLSLSLTLCVCVCV
jgi:hypothetical protein